MNSTHGDAEKKFLELVVTITTLVVLEKSGVEGWAKLLLVMSSHPRFVSLGTFKQVVQERRQANLRTIW